MVERLVICFSNKSRSVVISEYSSTKNCALRSTVADSSICGEFFINFQNSLGI